MLEEEKQTNETGEPVGMEQDYLAAINQIKNNSVPRQEYEQMKAENRKLLNAVINGVPAGPKEEEPVVINIDDLRKKAFAEGQSNLEYITNALALRSALIAKGERDPFLPCGDKTLPTESDIATANRVARIFQECIDVADGDSQIFTNELTRRTVDTAPRF